MEEEIPTRLGTPLADHAESCGGGGESRGRRKQERFEARELPLTLSQPFSCFACQGNSVLKLCWGKPSFPARVQPAGRALTAGRVG